jgi:carbon storage regulator
MSSAEFRRLVRKGLTVLAFIAERGSVGGFFPTPQQGGKSMLVLTRRVGEVIVIEKDIRITVVSVRGDKVRLGITAPEFVQVDREEVHQRRLGTTDPSLRLEPVSASS